MYNITAIQWVWLYTVHKCYLKMLPETTHTILNYWAHLRSNLMTLALGRKACPCPQVIVEILKCSHVLFNVLMLNVGPLASPTSSGWSPAGDITSDADSSLAGDTQDSSPDSSPPQIHYQTHHRLDIRSPRHRWQGPLVLVPDRDYPLSHRLLGRIQWRNSHA